jgi:hypothetical protein
MSITTKVKPSTFSILWITTPSEKHIADSFPTEFLLSWAGGGKGLGLDKMSFLFRWVGRGKGLEGGRESMFSIPMALIN